jgi:hypothetical protein
MLARLPAREFDERREGDAVAVGRGLSNKDPRSFAYRVCERGRQARLAHSGRCQDGHEHARVVLDRVFQRLSEHPQVAVASHQRRLDPGRRRTNAQDPLGVDRLGLSLELDRAQRREIHAAAEHPFGRRGDQHTARLGGRLQACRRVEHVPSDPPFGGRGLVGERLAAVDGDTYENPDVGIIDLAIEFGSGLPHLERGTHRAERVVLVGFRHAEGAPLTELSRAHQVAEEGRDQTATGFTWRDEPGPTLSAKLLPERVLVTAGQTGQHGPERTPGARTRSRRRRPRSSPFDGVPRQESWLGMWRHEQLRMKSRLKFHRAFLLPVSLATPNDFLTQQITF